MQRNSAVWLYFLHYGGDLPGAGNRLFPWVLKSLALLSLLGCAQLPQEQADGSPAQVQQVIEEAAFGREGRAGGGPLIRWCEAPVLAVPMSSSLSASVAGEVQAVARDITALTGLTFRTAGPDLPASYTVHAAADETVMDAVIDDAGLTRADRRKLRRARCFFRLSVREPGCIANAVIVVPDRLDGTDRSHCLLEEMTQAMGLVADGDFRFPSLFSERDRLPARTPTDDAALRLLYHPALEPGMSLEEARPVVGQILRREPGG